MVSSIQVFLSNKNDYEVSSNYFMINYRPFVYTQLYGF